MVGAGFGVEGVPLEESSEFSGLWCANADRRFATGEGGGDRFGGEESAGTDDDEVVGEHRELSNKVARDEHGAPVCGERAERVA